MNAKLFLFYLRFRKFLPAFALCSLEIATLNQYQSYQASIIRKPWIVEEILSGSSFTVRRGNKTKTIALCGIVSDEKDYLRSLINQGDLSVHLQKSHRSYEAWIVFPSPEEQQIHLNTEMLVANRATLNNYHNCLVQSISNWLLNLNLDLTRKV